MTLPLSRPKVHRLPVAPVRYSYNYGLWGFAVASILVLLSGGIIISQAIFKGLSSMDMAQEAPTSMAATPAEAVKSDASSDTIIIRDEKQAIVGQLARIPAQNQQITGIKSVSNVDNAASPELLSIVGKY